MSLSRCFVRGFRICSFFNYIILTLCMLLYFSCYLPYVISGSASQYQQSSKADWLNRTQYFNNTVRDLVADVMAKGEVAKTPSLEKRLVKLMEYDTLLRIPLQGHMTMMAYEVLENPKNLNEQNLYKAQVVSCAMELAQSYFLIMDDFEDQSETRHGQPCWHLLPEVKNLILNDACMFRSLVNDILKAHLNGPVYTKMIDIFNEMYLFVAIGQYLDNTIPKAKDASLYTLENYNKIIRYKCTYYCLEIPIMLSLILCGKDNEPTFERIRDIVRDVGALYQMMNDYTDLTNVESKAGKTSSDIQEGKCTFYAVNTMLRATPEQKEIFKASYGSWDPEDVKRIRKLYKDLDLISYYKEQHNSKYKQFMKNLDKLPSDDLLTPELFLKMMEASNLNNWEIY